MRWKKRVRRKKEETTSKRKREKSGKFLKDATGQLQSEERRGHQGEKESAERSVPPSARLPRWSRGAETRPRAIQGSLVKRQSGPAHRTSLQVSEAPNLATGFGVTVTALLGQVRLESNSLLPFYLTQRVVAPCHLKREPIARHDDACFNSSKMSDNISNKGGKSQQHREAIQQGHWNSFLNLNVGNLKTQLI